MTHVPLCYNIYYYRMRIHDAYNHGEGPFFER